MASWHGRSEVSRAEDLLPEISGLLRRTEWTKKDLDFVAVSNGPGSYTGIRIGIATGLGIARSLNIECVGVPLLPAMANSYDERSKIIVVVPIGKTDLCWQRFDDSIGWEHLSQPMTGPLGDLLEFSRNYCDFEILAQRGAFQSLIPCAEAGDIGNPIIDCGANLAFSVGLYARTATSDLTPNYVRNVRFGSNTI